ncbi:MAG: hypothetical protein PHS13_01800 [Firmicutes bacterium]|nr:hypothetical protein [Bacillota bacterium]
MKSFKTRVFIAILLIALFIEPATAAEKILFEKNIDVTNEELIDISVNANNQYVALGRYGLIKHSNDGYNWTVTNLNNQGVEMRAIASSPREFIVVGAEGNLFRSENCEDWEKITIDKGNFKEKFSDVVWNGKNFYAYTDFEAGYSGFSFTYQGYVLVSPDGVKWQSKKVNIPKKKNRTDNYYYKYIRNNVLWTGKKFLCDNGRIGSILESKDGVNWFHIYLDHDHGLGKLYDTGNGYIATETLPKQSDRFTYFYSKDGDAWEKKTYIATPGEVLTDFKWDNQGGYIVPGWYLHSLNGEQMIPKDMEVNNTFYGIKTQLQGYTKGMHAISKTIWDGGKFIGIGRDGGILVSKDSKTWDIVHSPVKLSKNLKWDGNQFVDFVHIADRTFKLISSDGVHWNAVEANIVSVMPEDMIGLYFTYTINNGEYIGVNRLNSGKWVTLTSADGVTWDCDNNNLDSLTHSNYLISATNGNIYVAVGRKGDILYSQDGTTWFRAQSNADYDLRGIVWNGEKFVVVGYGDILYSTDGINWIKAQYGDSYQEHKILSGVTWDGNRFIAVGRYGEMSSSEDGTYWVRETNDFGKADLEWIVSGDKATLLLGYRGIYIDLK